MDSLTWLLLWWSRVSAHSSSGDYVCMEIKLLLGTSSIKDINFVTYTPVRRFAAGNDRFVGRGELWGDADRRGRGSVLGGWNGPLPSLTPIQHHINNVHWQGYGRPMLRFSFRQCDFFPSFSSSIHGMLINAAVACCWIIFPGWEGERLGGLFEESVTWKLLRHKSLQWENHCCPCISLC